MRASAFALLVVGATFFVPPTAAAAALPTPDADNGGITLPDGFRALVVAENLGQTRFIAISPTGDLYVKKRRGGILALRDADGDGRFETKQEFGQGGGTGIALRGEWLYHSTDDTVYRYKMTPGELVPAGEPEVIVRDLPREGDHHSAKSFAFDGDGKLYVEVGSPSNAYGNPDRAYMPPGTASKDPTEFLKTHGGFWRFDPDKNGQTQADGFHFSTGHRHVLSVAWNPQSKALFIAQMGRDQLNTVSPENYNEEDNAERPAEEFHILREGANLGWPYSYYDTIEKARMLSPEHGGNKKKRAPEGQWQVPLVALPAHWAPLQMAFYQGTQFPEKYRGGAFIAVHGSWNRAPLPQQGYNVTFVPFDAKGMPVGSFEVFAKGFAGKEPLTRVRGAHRPGGLAIGPDGSLYVSDTDKGRIWRIVYAGETK
jgi:glucose/arabinose dehydrogenase